VNASKALASSGALTAGCMRGTSRPFRPPLALTSTTSPPHTPRVSPYARLRRHASPHSSPADGNARALRTPIVSTSSFDARRCLVPQESMRVLSMTVPVVPRRRTADPAGPWVIERRSRATWYINDRKLTGGSESPRTESGAAETRPHVPRPIGLRAKTRSSPTLHRHIKNTPVSRRRSSIDQLCSCTRCRVSRHRSAARDNLSCRGIRFARSSRAGMDVDSHTRGHRVLRPDEKELRD